MTYYNESLYELQQQAARKKRGYTPGSGRCVPGCVPRSPRQSNNRRKNK